MKLIILNARAQLIKSFVSPRARCRRRLGVLKVVNNNAMQGSKQSYLHAKGDQYLPGRALVFCVNFQTGKS